MIERRGILIEFEEKKDLHNQQQRDSLSFTYNTTNCSLAADRLMADTAPPVSGKSREGGGGGGGSRGEGGEGNVGHRGPHREGGE